ncbi:MAG: hypothetical protein EOP68_11265, partial [Sphingomonas sp.]
MTATIIDGKAHALALRGRVAEGVAAFRAETDRAPGLAVVLVGEDPASSVYVRSKGKATREAGMLSVERRLPAETDTATPSATRPRRASACALPPMIVAVIDSEPGARGDVA